ncbi:protein of unknown function [Chryseobacterium sp. JV274]|nr:protein of unknown function [Chryseobacterium sp. JV274]
MKELYLQHYHSTSNNITILDFININPGFEPGFLLSLCTKK